MFQFSTQNIFDGASREFNSHKSRFIESVIWEKFDFLIHHDAKQSKTYSVFQTFFHKNIQRLQQAAIDSVQ